jgi:hypothetical protein
MNSSDGYRVDLVANRVVLGDSNEEWRMRLLGDSDMGVDDINCDGVINRVVLGADSDRGVDRRIISEYRREVVFKISDSDRAADMEVVMEGKVLLRWVSNQLITTSTKCMSNNVHAHSHHIDYIIA